MRLIQKALLLCLLSVPAWAADTTAPLFSPDGYRITQYRSPTPARHEQARTLDTEGLRQLLAHEPRTRLVDVYRRTWLNERFIPDEVHANLPGSLWLANTGDGALAPDWQAYFSRNLERISQGDKDWPLVFYCRSDCWLGWNAARRAHALGYRNLYWYRDGIDAWQQAGLPLTPAEPQPFP
ncbi:PQQ-dependent catabolism-associated CXXCW motif protein [Metapseudomonas otitidis]|uniref:PQQ-dependent catabolism-associated CXXCW motif protein n=1 Tax=Metapseudomonas otitidis TaxID=319939 RepID=UPI001CA3BF52|nr:PQQ-dependent catabolism-associated CXXCW motif protein [Pseudomonas otitidis]MCO7555328.1 PQQ-dependent catabolism-associated CXXCW motif protein [Pseudomonas otitidis]QZX84718.1 PQQ-dependent catabolism-associated CXXCW motif protein [Pseudomonas otitidis]